VLLPFPDRQMRLNCSRQSGKSTVVGVLAMQTARFTPAALRVPDSPSQRQSAEFVRKVLDADNALGRPVTASIETRLRPELDQQESGWLSY
jgi:hypothetical protein